MQKWDKMTWEMLINMAAYTAYKGDFFGAYVENIKCVKFIHVFYIDKNGGIYDKQVKIKR